MNFWRRYLADILLFRKSERIASISLAVIILLLLLISVVWKQIALQQAASKTAINREQIALFEKALAESAADTARFEANESFNPFYAEKAYSPAAKSAGVLFPFDPNTVPEDSLRLLGFSEKQAKAFENFRSKGMKFYNETDLRKFRFLQAEKMEALIPFAVFPERKTVTYAKTEYTKPAEKSYALVELNTADSATLEALPGIGTKLSSGIVKYRNLLGGYHSVEQLREVYGMRDSTYQLVKKFFKADATLVKRIAINTATADDLRRHPLLRNPLAKLIVSFREQHGAFKSAADLKQLPIVTDSLLEKLQPYITFD